MLQKKLHWVIKHLENAKQLSLSLHFCCFDFCGATSESAQPEVLALSIENDTQFLHWCFTGKDQFISFTLVYVCSFLAL